MCIFRSGFFFSRAAFGCFACDPQKQNKKNPSFALNTRVFALRANSFGLVVLQVVLNSYSIMPLHATTPLSEWTQKTTLEHDYCRDFSCCGLRLTDLFALLDHYESCHMACNDMYSSSESSSVASSTSDLSAAATPAVKAMDAKSAITRTSSNRLPPTPPPELVRGGDASLAPGSVPFVLANAPASRKRSHTTTFQADDDETDLESCSALYLPPTPDPSDQDSDSDERQSIIKTASSAVVDDGTARKRRRTETNALSDNTSLALQCV